MDISLALQGFGPMTSQVTLDRSKFKSKSKLNLIQTVIQFD